MLTDALERIRQRVGDAEFERMTREAGEKSKERWCNSFAFSDKELRKAINSESNNLRY